MAKREGAGDASAEREGPNGGELTYPMGAAARLTGLTPDVLRAWERRYGVVEPVRTEGGTRRYRASDLERLRLVKAAVDAGHRIGEVARLDLAELERRGAARSAAPASPVEAVVAALQRLDAAEAERLIALQLAALGPVRFAQEFAIPLLAEVGDSWAGDRLCVASEHMGSSLLRSLLGSALRPSAASVHGPRIVFGTPQGERHEIGLLVAALTALGAGGNPIYLGPDLPLDELLRAVETVRANALALSLVALPAADAERAVRSLRAGLPADVELWVGGTRAAELDVPPHVERIPALDALERRVALLALRVGRERS